MLESKLENHMSYDMLKSIDTSKISSAAIELYLEAYARGYESGSKNIRKVSKANTYSEGARDFGNMLYEYRTKRGLSQAELANKLEVSPSLISHYESGASAPTIRSIYKICNKLGVVVNFEFDIPDEDK